jgi:RNA polymerase sigma-70 factor (ECF subfamily)
MAAPEIDDGELVRRAAAGDERAWRAIYDQTCQPLFNLLCWQLGDREAARDALQEAYLTAYKQLGSFRGEGSLLAWLRAIAIRKGLDWKRHLWRRLRLRDRLLSEPDTRDPRTEPAGDVAFEVERTALWRSVESLSPQQRAALLLHEMEELPLTEVAAALGCAEPTARVHLHRARERMKRMLAEDPAVAVGEGMGGQQA